MQSVTSATAVAATVRANNITLFASLELSKSKWVVTINSPGSEKFSKPVVEGGDGACLLDLLSRSRAKAEQRYGMQIKAIVIAALIAAGDDAVAQDLLEATIVNRYQTLGLRRALF